MLVLVIGRSKLLADEEDENTSDMDAALKDKDEKEKKKSLKKKVSSTAVNTTAAITGWIFLLMENKLGIILAL